MSHRFLKISTSPDADLLTLLDNNVIGTPGQGMLYQHLEVKNKIYQIAKPYFVNLVRHNSIAGTCCFCERTTINKSTEIKSFYIRYFLLSGYLSKKEAGFKIKLKEEYSAQ